MTHFNQELPLLHRPTFERSISERLHFHDPAFGTVVLLVCALGSRHVDDPRVYLPGHTQRSAGWAWFNQVDISRRDLFRPPRLYDVQAYILAARYGSLVFRGQLVWILLGVALRMIQQVGAHRKKIYQCRPNAHDELWKRCTWCADDPQLSRLQYTQPIIPGSRSCMTSACHPRQVVRVGGQKPSMLSRVTSRAFF
jgi:hypothetical protein